MAKKHSSSGGGILVRQVELYRRVHPQLKAMLEEMRELSKKRPDDAINKFKLGFVNEKLRDANAILGDDWKPLSTFSEFDIDALPSNSDVVIILSQYLGSLIRWQSANTFRDHIRRNLWNTDPPLEVG